MAGEPTVQPFRPQRVTLTCPCCGGDTDRLHYFAWCNECWYTVCGGDLASDADLERSPEVWITRANGPKSDFFIDGKPVVGPSIFPELDGLWP